MQKPSPHPENTPSRQTGTLSTARKIQIHMSQLLIPDDGSVAEESKATRFMRDDRY